MLGSYFPPSKCTRADPSWQRTIE